MKIAIGAERLDSMCRHVSYVAPTAVVCYECGEKGHIARRCAKATQVKRRNSFTGVDCYRCGEIGHIIGGKTRG